MLRSSRAASFGSVILFQPPSRQRRLARRRTAVFTLLGVAAASVIAGAILTRGGDEAGEPQQSPLSYLPL